MISYGIGAQWKKCFLFTLLLWGYLVCKVKTKGLSPGVLATFIQVDTFLLEETQELDHGTSLLLNVKLKPKPWENIFENKVKILGKKDDFFWKFVDK